MAQDLKDQEDLARFGYKQELDRSLGSFSSFAAGFSYISILTGMFQTFHTGFNAAGPAFFWTWPAVFVGQLLVALCFAELAAQYPLSGGVYQWSKQVGHPAIGWLAGWIFLACLIVTLAAVAMALQVTLPQIHSWFQFIGDGSTEADKAKNAVLLGCILIAFSTTINGIGVGLLARINNLGVFTELIGVALLIVLLAAHAVRGPEVLLATQGHGTGQAGGYLGPFLLAMTLTASYVLYGYDTAGALAEETHEPRRKAPRAILQALSAAAVAGALLLLTALLAAKNIDDSLLAKEEGGLPHVVKETLGDGLGTVFLVAVIIAITVCTLAVQTGAIRLMFAMARDNRLPFSRALARVSPTSLTPQVPNLVAGFLAVGILVANINFPKVVDMVIAVAILWANLAYLFVTSSLLARRLHGWPPQNTLGVAADLESAGSPRPISNRPPHFSMGRWGLLINVLAVLWGLFTVINIAWPRSDSTTPDWYQTFGPLLFTAGLVLGGGIYYAVVQRHKPGVLDEHQAPEG
jgi:urea carboxylase system permease